MAYFMQYCLWLVVVGLLEGVKNGSMGLAVLQLLLLDIGFLFDGSSFSFHASYVQNSAWNWIFLYFLLIAGWKCHFATTRP